MMRIILTGAGGFLGRHLINAMLNDTRYSIIAITSKQRELKDLYKNAINISVYSNENYKNLELSENDIFISAAYPTDMNDIKHISKGLDYVYDSFKYAVHNNVKNIINLSTQSVYGVNRTYEAYEDSPLMLDTAYALGKYCTELYFDEISAGSKVVHFRLASIIGPGIRRSINKMINKVKCNEDITVLGENQIYGYMDYRDAAESVIYGIGMLDAFASGGKYNISSFSYSFKEIAETIISVGNAHGYNSKISNSEKGVFKDTSLNSELFRSITGWNPKICLRDSIESIFCEDNFQGVGS